MSHGIEKTYVGAWSRKRASIQCRYQLHVVTRRRTRGPPERSGSVNEPTGLCDGLRVNKREMEAQSTPDRLGP